MHINAVADWLRAKLPWPIWNFFRKIANSLLGPLHFSLETGHLRSCLKSRAVDRKGEPLPWFVYSAIQFLLPKNFSQKLILEWGAGQSTFFWAKRASKVVSFEADPKWYSVLNKSKPANVSLFLVREDISDADGHLQDELFDIIVVDGLDRFKCAKRSLKLLAPNGAIIVDNSEGNHGPRPGYGIIDIYREGGLRRIDFYGYPPGNSTQQCTSIFCRADCFLLKGDENPLVTLSFWKIGQSS